MARQQTDWLTVGMESWLLGMEAARVMWLRGWLIALGGAAGEREARRMIEEKFLAASDYGWITVRGKAGVAGPDSAVKLVRHYSRRVRANGKRLVRH